jgi:excisionase family DNA binding protein
MAESQDTVLTIDQLAEYLKLSKSTLYHLARRGEVPGQKIGRHWRFHRAAIDKWLASGTGVRRRL